ADEVSPFICYTISAFSLMTNTILIIVYLYCPVKKMNSYRYFFLISAIQDIIFSVVFLLSFPRLISKNNVFVIISSGILNFEPIGYFLIIIFCVSYFTSVLVVTNSFLYRYLQLCRMQLFQRFSSSRAVVMCFVINAVLIIYYSGAVYWISFPDENLRYFVESSIIMLETKFCGASFIGLSAKYTMSTTDLVLLAVLFLALATLAVINIFCAGKIGAFLRKAANRHNPLKHQRRMFTLLLLQAACPFIFMQVPAFIAMFLVFAGIDSPQIITNSMDISFALQPFLNPVIIVLFLREYRDFVLVKLKLKRPLTARNGLFTISMKNNMQNGMPIVY
ncbi:hypothetical protein V3C99_009967, partial [Haemonchus contortus]